MKVPVIPTVYTTATRPAASAEWAGRIIRVRDAGQSEQLQACLMTSVGGFEWVSIGVASS